jgi:hypothetical protein
MILKLTLYLIAAFQLGLGVLFLLPGVFADLMGLEQAPPWTAWLFAMFGARAMGFGYGMVLAARDPFGNRSWIVAMVAVQGIDWLATLVYLATGAVTLAQVTTAAFVPLLFIFVLARHLFATPARVARANALSSEQSANSTTLTQSH